MPNDTCLYLAQKDYLNNKKAQYYIMGVQYILQANSKGACNKLKHIVYLSILLIEHLLCVCLSLCHNFHRYISLNKIKKCTKIHNAH